MKKKVSFSLFAGLVYNLILANNSGQNLAGNYVNCGGVAFPTGVVDVVHILILLLQIVVPIIVIILGSIDFAKATAGKNQDDILKKQKLFIKRLVAAGATFLIVSFVTLVVNMASDSTQLSSCAKCLTSGSSGCGSAASPNNPEFPSDNQLSSGNDSFNGYKLKENAYGKDNSNKPDDSNQNGSSDDPPGTTVVGTSDLSKVSYEIDGTVYKGNFVPSEYKKTSGDYTFVFKDSVPLTPIVSLNTFTIENSKIPEGANITLKKVMTIMFFKIDICSTCRI